MQITANKLASLVNGEVEGDGSVVLERPCRIEEGAPGGVSFLGNPKYEAHLYQTEASAVLVSTDLKLRKAVAPTLIRVKNVYNAVAVLLNAFQEEDYFPEGISELAFIHPGALLEDGVRVGPFAVIEEGAKIGAGTAIGAQAFVGADVVIGPQSKLYPGARIMRGCRLGKRCQVQSNAVIGAVGFGYALDEQSRYQSIPQLGNVVLEDDVEIGAGTTIDRASIGSTLIKEGTKIDNLVQVAHNVTIGAHTAIAAQAGIAGSSKLGEGVQLGGQAGVAGHLELADGVRVQAQSGIASPIRDEGQAVYGSPALAYHQFLRSYAIFKHLPDLKKRVEELEKALASLTDSSS